MHLRDDNLILGVAAGLALAVTLVVTTAVQREPAARPAATPALVQSESLATVAVTIPEARTRATPDVTNDDLSPVDAARRREMRRREAQYLEAFQTLRAEQGDAALERSVREVLAAVREPAARKIAALRALQAAGLPGADAVLSAAVESQPDVADESGASVPRAALKLLFERAPANEDARRELARLARAGGTQLSDELRKAAAAALAASTAHAPR